MKEKSKKVAVIIFLHKGVVSVSNFVNIGFGRMLRILPLSLTR